MMISPLWGCHICNREGQPRLLFDKHKELDMARFEVANLIRQVYPDLPARVNYPYINLVLPVTRKAPLSPKPSIPAPVLFTFSSMLRLSWCHNCQKSKKSLRLQFMALLPMNGTSFTRSTRFFSAHQPTLIFLKH